MLEMRQECERCQKVLPMDSADAMICSYKCTFCRECTEGVLSRVCPNCKGELKCRPSRQS